MKNKRDQEFDDHDLNVMRAMRNKSRRGFLVMGISAAAGLGGWEWLRTRPKAGDLSYPLRRTLEFNEKLAESYFNEARLSPTFPREMASEPRVNGDVGLPAEFEPSTWRLQVVGAGRVITATGQRSIHEEQTPCPWPQCQELWNRMRSVSLMKSDQLLYLI